MNVLDKLPVELNTARLPLSYQFYETVPILMTRCLEVIKIKKLEPHHDESSTDLIFNRVKSMQKSSSLRRLSLKKKSTAPKSLGS